jgi:hypothetical protein
MSEHTPGPWWVGPHYKSDVESSEGRITECRPMQTPRAIANAHLIAAAPELLAALKKAVTALDYEGFGTDDFRAVVAKAEGDGVLR